MEGEVRRHGCQRGASDLRSLEDEGASRLKHLVADFNLDREMLKAVIAKNGLSSFSPEERSSRNWFAIAGSVASAGTGCAG